MGERTMRHSPDERRGPIRRSICRGGELKNYLSHISLLVFVSYKHMLRRPSLGPISHQCHRSRSLWFLETFANPASVLEVLVLPQPLPQIHAAMLLRQHGLLALHPNRCRRYHGTSSAVDASH